MRYFVCVDQGGSADLAFEMAMKLFDPLVDLLSIIHVVHTDDEVSQGRALLKHYTNV